MSFQDVGRKPGARTPQRPGGGGVGRTQQSRGGYSSAPSSGNTGGAFSSAAAGAARGGSGGASAGMQSGAAGGGSSGGYDQVSDSIVQYQVCVEMTKEEAAGREIIDLVLVCLFASNVVLIYSV